MQKLLTVAEVCSALSVSRATLYKLKARADFPAPVYITATAPRWDAEEISAWLASRPRAT